MLANFRNASPDSITSFTRDKTMKNSVWDGGKGDRARLIEVTV
jgi:hypothetical protein